MAWSAYVGFRDPPQGNPVSTFEKLEEHGEDPFFVDPLGGRGRRQYVVDAQSLMEEVYLRGPPDPSNGLVRFSTPREKH